MLSKLLTLSLTLTLVTAHGKVTSITGDAGGNGTALAIQGGIVPNVGPNEKTEVDTTVFKSTDPLSDGLGKTTGGGKNKVNMVVEAMALSGPFLPQISTSNGTISGEFLIVTTDGAGPLSAVLDATATGKFSDGVLLRPVVQVPGNKGNIDPPTKKKQNQNDEKRSLLSRAFESLKSKRGGAQNVNLTFPFKFAVPPGTVCNGTVAGMTGVCLVKIANSNKAGPFGGVVMVQQTAAENNVGKTQQQQCGERRRRDFKA
ncbi:hypothetical protein QBC43DRAFT_306318 [Cladorrhinum sp. PSN259]|nr:hypothetical protein QBC43DRAFT_306318 [Cladorrhinum sp. PSN259]